MNATQKTHLYYLGLLDTIEEVVKEKYIELITMGTIYSGSLKNFLNKINYKVNLCSSIGFKV